MACLGSHPCVGFWRADNGIRLLGLVASDARRVVWDYGIHPKDAIHVASAMHFKNRGLMRRGDTLVFHTFDERVLKHGDGIDGIPFVAPKPEDYPLQTKMDLASLTDGN